MEILCVNDYYTSEQLQFFTEHNVEFPREGKIYTLRDSEKHSNGRRGIRVKELINNVVPLKHSVLKVIHKEPSFYEKRFVTLLGNNLTEEILEEIKEKV